MTFKAVAKKRVRPYVRKIFATLSAIAVVLSAFYPAVAAVVLPALAGTALLWWLLRTAEGHSEFVPKNLLALLTYGSYAIHFVLGAAIMFTPAAEYLGPDAFAYRQDALGIVEHWNGSDELPSMGKGKEGFSYLLAAMFWAWGPYVIGGLIINASLAAALIPLMAGTSNRLFGAKHARHVPMLLVVIPGFWVWTAQLLREAGVLFLLALSAFLAVRLTQSTRPGSSGWLIVGLGCALAVLFTFRPSTALLVLVSTLLVLVFSHRKLLPGLLSSLGTAAVVAVVVLVIGVGQPGFWSSVNVGQDRVEGVRDITEEAESEFPSYGPIVDAVRVIAGPFPWELSGLRQLPAIGFGLFVWALLPFLVSGLWLVGRRIVGPERTHGARALLLLTPAICLVALLTLSVGNYGLLLRLRTQVILLVLPFCALGLSNWLDCRATRNQPSSTSSIAQNTS